MGNRLTSSHLVLGYEVRRGEAMPSHLCNVMQKHHRATFTVSPVGQAERKAGAVQAVGQPRMGSQRQSSQFRELRLREAR